MASSSNNLLSLKLDAAGDLRRVVIPAGSDLAALRATIGKSFGDALGSTAKLAFKDSEGDLVTVATADEWAEAKRQHAGPKPLRVFVTAVAAADAGAAAKDDANAEPVDVKPAKVPKEVPTAADDKPAPLAVFASSLKAAAAARAEGAGESKSDAPSGSALDRVGRNDFLRLSLAELAAAVPAYSRGAWCDASGVRLGAGGAQFWHAMTDDGVGVDLSDAAFQSRFGGVDADDKDESNKRAKDQTTTADEKAKKRAAKQAAQAEKRAAKQAAQAKKRAAKQAAQAEKRAAKQAAQLEKRAAKQAAQDKKKNQGPAALDLSHLHGTMVSLRTLQTGKHLGVRGGKGGWIAAAKAESEGDKKEQKQMDAELLFLRVAVHLGVTCDVSGMCPIVGPRFKKKGANYDLCEAEFDKLTPEQQAAFVRIDFNRKGGGNQKKGPKASAVSHDVDGHRGLGAGGLFELVATRDAEGRCVVRLKNARSNGFLRIVNGNTVDCRGQGGRLCLFRAVPHQKDGSLSLMSLAFPGHHVGVRGDGSLKPPSKTGRGAAGRFVLVLRPRAARTAEKQQQKQRAQRRKVLKKRRKAQHKAQRRANKAVRQARKHRRNVRQLLAAAAAAAESGSSDENGTKDKVKALLRHAAAAAAADTSSSSSGSESKSELSSGSGSSSSSSSGSGSSSGSSSSSSSSSSSDSDGKKKKGRKHGWKKKGGRHGRRWRKIARAMGMGMHMRHKMKMCKMHMMGAMGVAPPMMHGAGAMAANFTKEQVDAVAAVGFPPRLAYAALVMASGSAAEAVALLTERRGAVRRFMRHNGLGAHFRHHFGRHHRHGGRRHGRGPHGHGPPHGFRDHHGPRGHRHGFPTMAPQLAPPPAVDQQLVVREA